MTADGTREPESLSAAYMQMLRELTERARVGGLKLTGEGGLLGKLTKMVVEGALEGELDDHLGYARHDPAGRRRQFPERLLGENGNHRGGAGGDIGAAGPGFQFRAENCR